ncbi:MAG: tRNA preQ1(34) S-adenosylmethionine ribosyltransferase-isomerase QueA [Alphaproteobacteria bacterium]|nr:tRNA preQ1(34) S-adenosylmethionine ribosyltransferase-isomerase QueA [Alphaproteobacteria bacterium]
MKVDIFDFDLPRELIADRPAVPRDSARLLEVSAEKDFQDSVFSKLPEMLQSGDVMVFNNTRVIPARIYGFRDSVRVEVMLCQQIKDGFWRALARPGKRLKIGQKIVFGNDFFCEVIKKEDGGEILIKFNETGNKFSSLLEQYGNMPLPPYISRNVDELDSSDYQTVYASENGAVAAPTAGLHFTPEILEKLDNKGVKRVNVTLHVGAGTFLPVKVEDTDDHIMHSEYGVITKDAVDIINSAKADGARIIAVGTTSLRVLESASDKNGFLKPFADETDIFITPGYKFKIVDNLMTNFHLPRSTLFMLVCAFAGTEKMHAAYEHAKNEKYRFYSYGDTCFLHSKNHLHRHCK